MPYMRRMLQQRQAETVRLVIKQAVMKDYSVHNSFDENNVFHDTPIAHLEKRLEADGSVCQLGLRNSQIPLFVVPQAWPVSWLQARPRGQEPVDLPPTRQFSGRSLISPHATCQEAPHQINP